jgi:pentatricopeptide repeat protein
MDVGVITWTALISGYFRGGWEHDGWDAVSRMEAANLRLNRISYNLILNQAGKKVSYRDGEIPTTIRLFSRMIESGVRPNTATYTILLEPLVREQMWYEADKVVKMMEQLRFLPDKKELRELLKKVKFRRRLDYETVTQRLKRQAMEGRQG